MDPVFREELAEVLVGPNPEVSVVFLFNGSHMGVLPLPAKRLRFVSTADSPHSWCVFHMRQFWEQLYRLAERPPGDRLPACLLSLVNPAFPPYKINFSQSGWNLPIIKEISAEWTL